MGDVYEQPPKFPSAIGKCIVKPPQNRLIFAVFFRPILLKSLAVATGYACVFERRLNKKILANLESVLGWLDYVSLLTNLYNKTQQSFINCLSIAGRNAMLGT